MGGKIICEELGFWDSYRVDVSDSLCSPQLWLHLDVSLNHIGRLGDQGGQYTRQDPTAEISQGGWNRCADFCGNSIQKDFSTIT